MTGLDDLLDFGPLLKSLAAINLPKSPTFLSNFCKGVKINHFSIEIILGKFYRHLTSFSGHTGGHQVSLNKTLSKCRWNVALKVCFLTLINCFRGMPKGLRE